MEILIIFLECLFLAVVQVLGIGFHVGQKIVSLGDKYPGKSREEIIAIFKKEDWDTLFISGLVVVLHIVAHVSVEIYGPDIRDGLDYYMLWDLGLALFGGYAGQRVIYRIFGTAEKVLNKKVDSIQ
jgi:hypothetical protein